MEAGRDDRPTVLERSTCEWRKLENLYHMKTHGCDGIVIFYGWDTASLARVYLRCAIGNIIAARLRFQ